ncbi:MAG: hypothetical protein H6825_13800 [Planctomycetes bacterium]|nr:hypothetical protein [Planctomycetota bacterium]
MDAPRLLVGNLDAESDLARAAARARGATREHDATLALPDALLERLAAVSTLMRALARDDDRLLVSRPVGDERVLAVDGLPRCEPTTDAKDAGAARTLVPWSSAPAVDALRAARVPHDRRAGDAAESDVEIASDATLPLWMRLRHVPRSDAAVQLRVARRAFAHELERRFGGVPDGARAVRTWSELLAHLRAGGASASPAARFVLKPPFSAAGRGHVHGRVGEGPDTPDDAAFRRRVERLLAAHGELLFEPWLERLGDLGCGGLVLRERVDVLPPHGLLSDGRGRFGGIVVGAAGGTPVDIGAAHARELEASALRAGEALAEAGFRGPFAIDAFVYRGSDGEPTLRPLVELNPRLTFGLLARALVERVPRAARGTILRMGRSDGALPPGAVALLAPGAYDDSEAWLEPPGTPVESAVGTPRDGTRTGPS